MTKTETLILAQLNNKARGYFVASTTREIVAGRRLVAAGLAVQTSVTTGRSDVIHTQFGRFRHTVKRVDRTREVKFEKADLTGISQKAKQ
tara:strand:- start:488 stop:757 length:270 start_codon:yes stop_codon:yes gene_type:complete